MGSMGFGAEGERLWALGKAVLLCRVWGVGATAVKWCHRTDGV